MMRVPVATYRLQFHAGFGFADALELLDYLRDLGITDLYASPVFTAGPGSMHGYDVADPLSFNPELGGREGFLALSDAVREHGLGWIQDIVPNHMAVTSGNTMLMDVLESGPESRFYRYFDIDWDHPYADIKGVLLMPFLGRTYGDCLEAGELVLRYGEAGLSIHYYDFRFPLALASYQRVFDRVCDRVRQGMGREHPDFIKLLGTLYVLRHMTGAADPDERADQIAFVKRLLWELYGANPYVRATVDEVVREFNGTPGEPDSFTALDALLAEQHFKLSYWKVATQEINYRRFFNINGLISLAAEREEVFRRTHGLILEMVREGRFTGLRIDHIDGLFDPTEYLRRLREAAPETYVVVEKILEPDEEMPAFWPVQGSSGYDFAQHLTYLFCDATGERPFRRIYEAATGMTQEYADIVLEKKKLIVEKDMAGDVEDLAFHMKAMAALDRCGRDITMHGLKQALVELLAAFPVYRTYLSPDVLRPADRDYIHQALRQARRRNPDLLYELDFLERLLLLENGFTRDGAERSERIRLAMRFQQLSGPLMAKGFEDTTLYVYNRLLSLNEVGGNPSLFGEDASRWHAFCRHRAERWPLAMNASSTHDTKRGEDMRMRLNVLSELPEEWRTAVASWAKGNRRLKAPVAARPAPDPNDEYFLYQTLLGAMPPDGADNLSGASLDDFRARIREYVIKAVREAKVHTEWIKPDTEYEEAFLAFIDKLLDRGQKDSDPKGPGRNDFLEELRPLADRVAFYGFLNTLSATLLKIAAPGVPDFYQGSELWNLSLVDPDNRRPVDFAARRTLLASLLSREADGTLAPRELLQGWRNGAAKLLVVWRGLRTRRERPELFAGGEYLPLAVEGQRARHLLAFARRREGEWAVCLAPLYPAGLVREGDFPLGRTVWGDTRVLLPEDAPDPPAGWTDGLTGATTGRGRELLAGEVLADFPAALLISPYSKGGNG